MKRIIMVFLIALVFIPTAVFASDDCSHPSLYYIGADSINSTYHMKEYLCEYCSDAIYVKEKHNKKWGKGDYGWEYGCSKCDYCEFDATLYYTLAYKNKNYIKVFLEGRICEGDLLTVKVGKRTYKKRVQSTKNGAKYKLKIKKPRKNSKIKVYVTHRGKKLYLGHEYVMTSFDPKIGMTKFQVKNYTGWGSPDSTKKSSGGYSYWYYDDDSYIVFKNGRVRYWYG